MRRLLIPPTSLGESLLESRLAYKRTSADYISPVVQSHIFLYVDANNPFFYQMGSVGLFSMIFL